MEKAELIRDIALYLRQHYYDESWTRQVYCYRRSEFRDTSNGCYAMEMPPRRKPAQEQQREIEKLLAAVGDESFSALLLRLIDERGLTDAECYKKALVDRRLFSKIRSTPDYRPKKATVLAFVLALELSRAEADLLLSSAGFSLSGSSKTDVIIRYFIEHEQYDIMLVNEMLYAFDEPALGGVSP